MLSVTLTAMALPPAAPSGSSAQGVLAAPLDSGPASCRLRLTPGEPSELVVQVRNQRSEPLGITLRVEGAFPRHWYQVGQEGSFLPGDRQMDGVVQFSLPSDYFERHPLGPGQTLPLDYRGQVVIEGRAWGGEGTDLPSGALVTQTVAPFTLALRPHSLYPRFLPSLYREVDFIGRLLAIFEQTFEPDVHTLETLWAYLDPLTAPEGLLPFLAHWVGWQGIGPWPLATQRRLIRRALELYRFRGTRRGLRLYLHLYTGLPLEEETMVSDRPLAIAITERFTQGFILGQAHLGETTHLGGGKPFHFQVHLRPPPDHPPLDEALLHTIIQQEKPAFCTYDLVIHPPTAQDPPVPPG